MSAETGPALYGPASGGGGGGGVTSLFVAPTSLLFAPGGAPTVEDGSVTFIPLSGSAPAPTGDTALATVQFPSDWATASVTYYWSDALSGADGNAELFFYAGQYTVNSPVADSTPVLAGSAVAPYVGDPDSLLQQTVVVASLPVSSVTPTTVMVAFEAPETFRLFGILFTKVS